nr:serine hydrolase [Acidimicrobiia bacterium]
AEGHHWGYDGLELAARDLLKLGLLYLHGGAWAGTRVVDQTYVRTATSPLMEGGPPEQCGYGLLWWVADRATTPSYFAGGHGGQYVVVVPELDLVVVTMGDADAMAYPAAGRPCAGSSTSRSCRRSGRRSPSRLSHARRVAAAAPSATLRRWGAGRSGDADRLHHQDSS